MTKTFLQFLMMFILLVVAQSVIFNHIALFSVALAFVFIYFIIRLPVSLSGSRVIALSFLIGFVIDIFSDTPGMNALACTCAGACRRSVLRLYIPRDEDLSHVQPGIRSLGAAVFSKYVLTMSLLYCVLIFTIESFSFFNPLLLLSRMGASALLTTLLILAIDSLCDRSLAPARRHEKRL